MDKPHTDHTGCSEYQVLERRQFLRRLGGAGALAAIAAPAWLPRMAFAADEDSARDLLVCVFLRGGADGLSLCPPHGDAEYFVARPKLAVPAPDAIAEPRALDLDGFFGLHPALAPLKPLYDDANLAIVHACGSPDPTRSHFEAQDFMEMGTPGALTTVDGWLGRHLTHTPVSGDTPLRGVAAGHAIPRALAGAPATIAMPSIEEYGLLGREETTVARQNWLSQQYADSASVLTATATNVTATLELIAQLRATPYTPASGANYPDNEWGLGLRTIAQLAKADTGLEAACIDLGGWDTHSEQGTLQGELNDLITEFASGVNAFATDMADRMDRLTLVVMSEFGRRVEENGSVGTDHGHGNVMFVLGGNVAGGQVIANWPGLHADQLDDERDVAITIDYRDILAEILTKRAANNALDLVFPNYAPTTRGVIAQR